MTYVRLFLVVFCLGLFTQSLLWRSVLMVDGAMWAQHAEDIESGDEKMFDPGVYGHPGTPIVLVTIAANLLFGVGYGDALNGSLTILVALAGAVITVLARYLRPQSLWWLTLPPLLFINTLYLLATPPTVVVSPLLVLIVLLTWILYEQGSGPYLWRLLLWSFVVGLAAAVRTDITGITTVPLLLFLLFRIGWRQALVGALVSLLVFSFTNPFMWFMPFQHAYDLVHVALFHYTEYGSAPISFHSLIS